MAITNGYVELSLLKSSLQIEDNLLDDFLELAIESASRQIDAACERTFYQADGRHESSHLGILMLWRLTT